MPTDEPRVPLPPVPAVPARPPADAVCGWVARSATPDQRRILRSLLGAPDARLPKRQLQWRLNRIPAARLNAALAGLEHRGILRREGRWVVITPDHSAALACMLVRAVGSRGRSRALTSGGAGSADPPTPGAPGRVPGRARRRQPQRLVAVPDRHGRLHFMPALVNGRRPVPPDRRSSAWGRSMLARRGGLAVQRRYRAFGIHPTAAATAARIARATSSIARPAPASAVFARTASSPASTAPQGHRSGPALAPPGGPQAASTIHDASAVFSPATTIGARLSEAIACERPLGRTERLHADRRRR